ncbi:MAG: hypothetical protein ACREX8_05165 [Gammaproteobacteria bacterium]
MTGDAERPRHVRDVDGVVSDNAARWPLSAVDCQAHLLPSEGDHPWGVFLAANRTPLPSRAVCRVPRPEG